jgi:SAM-dependent methyltransferase
MPAPSPENVIDRFISGYWISQAIYVVCKLNIADRLKDGPQSIEDLAAATKTDTRSLYRLLRALASVEIFAEEEGRRFCLTPLGEPLRQGVPGSKHALALMMGEEHFRAWGELLYSVQTGKTAFEKVFNLPIFDFLAQHPEKAQIFDDAMMGIHGRETAAMLPAYNLDGVKVLADIGGGNGSNLSAVLKQYPNLRGILFDLPHVVERARPRIAAAGLNDRCDLVSGDFFKSVPAADAYMLRHIIHDWSDEQSLRILQSIHRAMPQDGRLLLVESVIPPGNGPSLGKLLDLVMLTIPGGLERTEEEYRELYASAGFKLTRIVPTDAEVSVIEGRKA